MAKPTCFLLAPSPSEPSGIAETMSPFPGTVGTAVGYGTPDMERFQRILHRGSA